MSWLNNQLKILSCKNEFIFTEARLFFFYFKYCKSRQLVILIHAEEYELSFIKLNRGGVVRWIKYFKRYIVPDVTFTEFIILFPPLFILMHSLVVCLTGTAQKVRFSGSKQDEQSNKSQALENTCRKTGNKQKKQSQKDQNVFHPNSWPGSSTAIMCPSMTCLLPQIVTQAQNTQHSLGRLPSNSQQNHRPQSPSRAPVLLLDSCCIHRPRTKPIFKHFHRSANSPKKTWNKWPDTELWKVVTTALDSTSQDLPAVYLQALFLGPSADILQCMCMSVEYSTLGSTVYQWGTICGCYCC